MAQPETRRSLSIFALLYIPLAIAGGWYLWSHLKPAFDSINAAEPAVEEINPPSRAKGP